MERLVIESSQKLIMLSSKNLDFLVIGAQKAGTTTLFKLLNASPDIYIPESKEIPFFTRDDLYDAGLMPYLREYFCKAPEGSLWGTVTPHYLSDPRAARRISDLCPGVKLIAILRDPVQRAFSHYRMSLRRQIESRSFNCVIDELLERKACEEARSLSVGIDAESKCYVVWGEYGRLLTPYYEYFGSENILVLFTMDLERNPMATIEAISDFLCVDRFMPKSLGKKYHMGGDRERIPWAKNFARNKLGRLIIKSIPKRFRTSFKYWYHQFNTVKKERSVFDEPGHIVHHLRSHYVADTEMLEKLLGSEVPWNTSLDEGEAR